MDDKRIAEIRGRLEKANVARVAARTVVNAADIRDLLAEVDRLTTERDHAQIDLTATTQTCRDMEVTIASLRDLALRQHEMLNKMRALFDYRAARGCATETELELIGEHAALAQPTGGEGE